MAGFAPRAAGVLLAALLSLPALAGPPAKAGPRALGRSPVVVLDAGHGGSQEGAVGPSGVPEKQLALQTALLLGGLLEERLGATVVLTRREDADLSLAERVVIANRAAPDLFISLHANSMPTRRLQRKTRGAVTFFLSAHASGDEARRTADRENAEAWAPEEPGGGGEADTLSFILADLVRREAHAESSRLAYAVQRHLVAATRAVDRGVEQAPFFVLTGVLAPAILVEMGFLSHPEEGKRLGQRDYQRKVALGILEGVESFLEEVAPKLARPAEARSASGGTP